MLRLQRFLDARKVGPGQAATHTSMAGGSYYVMGCDNDALFEAYVAAALQLQLQQQPRCSLSLTERPRHIGPVRIDLDFRPSTLHSVATLESTAAFVRGMFAQLRRLVLLPDGVAAFVLTKPPRQTGKGVIKDGIHILVPDVVTRPEVQHLLRDSMLPFVAELFGGSCSNGPGDIYDAAVIDRNGWLLYASKKPDEAAAWTLGCVLTPEGVDITGDFLDMGIARLVPLLSIRNKHAECECTDVGRSLLDAMLAAHEAAQEAKKRAAAASAAFEVAGADKVAEDLGELARTVASLSPERAREYDSWMRVAFGILHTSGGSDEGRAILHRFSASCADKYDAGEVDTWWNANRRNQKSDGVIGMGSLCMWAKEDSHKQQITDNSEDAVSGKAMPSLVAALRASCPMLLSALPDDTVFDTTNGGLSFALPPIHGKAARFTVLKGTHRILRAEEGAANEDVGSLIASYSLGKHSLAFLDKSLLPAEPLLVQCTEVSTEQTDLTSAALQGSLVSAFHDGNFKFVSAKVKGVCKESVHTTAPKMAALSSLIGGARKAALERQLGPDVVAMFDRCNVLNNNGTIVNVSVHLDPEANRHTDHQLVKAVIAANPSLMERYKFVPDVKASSCNGIYVCDRDTNVWKQRHNVEIEETLVGLFADMELSDADRKHVESRRGGNDMIYKLAGKVVDNAFFEKLDANPDLFAVANGLVDWSTGGEFRAIMPADAVSKTAGWPYDPEQSAAHRADFEAFMREVLPVAEEREVVLVFLARLLSGHRNEKKFMMMTDRRAGNNGKSALLKLFEGFFGGYSMKNAKFLCRGSFEPDRNSHDAGYQPLCGLRFLLADELKSSMQLDDALIKRVAGGPLEYVTGRLFNSGERFSFLWQAGIVMAFNENDCPKFDAADTALLARMLVVPFRSKFVTDPAQVDREQLTFLMDADMLKRAAAWRSAILDVLRERATMLDVLHAPPASMSEWKQELSNGANTLADWLATRVTVTGNRSDFILLGELLEVFKGDKSADKMHVATSKFVGLAKAYFATCEGVTIPKTDVYSVKVDGRFVSKRNVVLGAVVDA